MIELQAAPPPEAPTLRIEPQRGWSAIDLSELWEYRELLFYFTWREVKVRYKQTLLGAAWAILQPVSTMVIFSVFLGRLARVPSDGIPYPVFAYAGLLPWTYFAQSFSEASSCVVEGANLVRKVYFPRLILPLAGVVSPIVDLGFALLVLAGLMAYYRVVPGPQIVLLPVFLLLAMAAALGAGLWMASINVKYRDVRYIVPFLIQTWMFASPVVYPSSLLPARWRFLYGLNPMAGVIEGFRWVLVGTQPSGALLLSSLVTTAALAAGGAFFFRRMERSFADMV